MNVTPAGRRPIGAGLAMLLIAFSLFSALSVPLATPLVDPFHEGEYLSPQLYFLGSSNGLPLLIHGMLNYAPARWAVALCGSDHVVICTRAANMWLAATASAIWALSAAGLMRSRQTAWLAGLTAGMLLLLFNGTRIDSVGLHQGAPSVRDLLLLCELAALLGVLKCRRPYLLGLLFAVAGIAAAIGLFWAYSRGLVGIVILASGLVLAWYAGRSPKTILVAPIAFLATLAGMYLHDPAMFGQHIANIRYWGQHREIWTRPFPVHDMMFGVVYVGLIAVGVLRSFQLHLAARRGEAATLLLLMIPVAAIYYQSINRSDLSHQMWAVEFAYLLVVAFVATLAWPLQLSTRWYSAALAAVGAMILLVLAIHAVRRPNSLVAHGSGSNLALATRPMPNDEALEGNTARLIGAMLRSTGQHCTYVMNNTGVYYEAAGLPPCTSSMYPIYVARGDEEARIIADLERTRPLLIIGHDGSWSDAMDGKSIADRTPLLSAWLDRHYPVSGHVNKVEIRRRSDTGETGRRIVEAVRS